MKYFSVMMFKITFKKFVSIRFVLMVTENPSSLNNAIISFLILTSFEQFALFIAASPSSLYKPTQCLSMTVLAHKFWLHHKISP